MSLAGLINRPCTLRHKTAGTTTDRDGNAIPAAQSIATVVELQQVPRVRGENDEEISDTTWVAFFLPGETVGSGDEIDVDGVTYQVEGDPWPVRNPRTQQASHVEATVRRVAGALD